MKVKRREGIFVSILRILFLCSVIVLCIVRKSIIQITSAVMSSILGFVAGTIVSFSILGIYKELARIILLYDKRKKERINNSISKSEGEDKTIEDILSMLIKNDIIEIWIRSDAGITVLGASSDSNSNASSFFGKRFYLDDQEDVSIDFLEKKMNEIAHNGYLKVISIDDVLLDRKKNKKRAHEKSL